MIAVYKNNQSIYNHIGTNNNNNNNQIIIRIVLTKANRPSLMEKMNRGKRNKKNYVNYIFHYLFDCSTNTTIRLCFHNYANILIASFS